MASVHRGRPAAVRHAPGRFRGARRAAAVCQLPQVPVRAGDSGRGGGHATAGPRPGPGRRPGADGRVWSGDPVRGRADRGDRAPRPRSGADPLDGARRGLGVRAGLVDPRGWLHAPGRRAGAAAGRAGHPRAGGRPARADRGVAGRLGRGEAMGVRVHGAAAGAAVAGCSPARTGLGGRGDDRGLGSVRDRRPGQRGGGPVRDTERPGLRAARARRELARHPAVGPGGTDPARLRAVRGRGMARAVARRGAYMHRGAHWPGSERLSLLRRRSRRRCADLGPDGRAAGGAGLDPGGGQPVLGVDGGAGRTRAGRRPAGWLRRGGGPLHDHRPRWDTPASGETACND